MKRVAYLDTLKWLAGVIIFTVHFISYVRPSFFDEVLRTMPWYAIVGGFTGKYAVTLFAAIIGYLPYVAPSSATPARYFVRRYLYFVIGGFIANASYWMLGVLGIMEPGLSLPHVVKTSLILGYDIYTPFWCIQSFFIISVVAYLNAKCNVTAIGVLLEIIGFYLTGLQWVALGLIGCLAAALLQREGIKKALSIRIVPWILIVIALVIIKQPESDAAYIADAISSALIIVAVGASPLLSKALSTRFFAFLGENAMAFFLLHMFVIVGMLHITARYPVLSYAAALAVLTVISVIVNRIIKLLMRLIP